MSALALVLVLATLQGLTEFLPVSSSGHLVLARSFLPGGEQLEANAALEVWLHIGTVIAVLVYYRREVSRLALGVLGRGEHAGEQRHLFGMLVLGSLPAALIGVGMQDQIETLFRGPGPASYALLLTGLVLWLSPQMVGKERRLRGVTIQIALIVGIAQAMAIMPGISRSGITIVVAMGLGLTAEAAATFSFLLSIPAILGAGLLKLRDIEGSSLTGGELAAGLSTSFVVGLGSLVLLVFFAKNRRLHWFAPYCWIVGGASLLAIWLGYGPAPPAT